MASQHNPSQPHGRRSWGLWRRKCAETVSAVGFAPLFDLRSQVSDAGRYRVFNLARTQHGIDIATSVPSCMGRGGQAGDVNRPGRNPIVGRHWDLESTSSTSKGLDLLVTLPGSPNCLVRELVFHHSPDSASAVLPLLRTLYQASRTRPGGASAFHRSHC